MSWKILQHRGLAWYGIELLKHARHLGKSEEKDMPEFFGQPSPWNIYIKDSATCPWSLRHMGTWVQAAAKLYAMTMWMASLRVRTCSWTKKPSTFQGHSGTYFPFFKDSIQCKKEPWVYVFFSSFPTWAILYFYNFYSLSVFVGLDKVRTFQHFSRTFQHSLQFSRTFKALNFYFKIQEWTFKVCANPIACLRISCEIKKQRTKIKASQMAYSLCCSR